LAEVLIKHFNFYLVAEDITIFHSLTARFKASNEQVVLHVYFKRS